MPKYLIEGNYVDDGIKGLLADGGSSRREAVTALVESLGGSVECMYYAFGDTDVYVVAEMPDNVSAAAASLVASGTGAVRVKVRVLLSPEELDRVADLAPQYRPPGG